MKITKELLRKCLPECTDSNAEKFTNPLNLTFEKFQINTPERVASFLAQCAHESISLNVLSENLNYSASGLLKIFGKYFTPELAEKYARKPEMIANRVYANRMGNGDEQSGDGWKFRGRGIIQTTGKNNYQLASDALNYDFISNPDGMILPGAASMTAGLYWHRNKLNDLADLGTMESFRTITKKINRGFHGLEDRIRHWNNCKKALNILS